MPIGILNWDFFLWRPNYPLMVLSKSVVSYEWSQPETGFEWSHHEFQTDWFLSVLTHVLWWLRDCYKEKVSLLDKWWVIVEFFFCLYLVVPYSIHYMLSFRAGRVLMVFCISILYHKIEVSGKMHSITNSICCQAFMISIYCRFLYLKTSQWRIIVWPFY